MLGVTSVCSFGTSPLDHAYLKPEITFSKQPFILQMVSMLIFLGVYNFVCFVVNRPKYGWKGCRGEKPWMVKKLPQGSTLRFQIGPNLSITWSRWFHLQNEIKPRWGDSKNDIGSDVHHVYEDVVVHYLGSPNFSAFAPGLSLSIFMPRCYESHAQSLGVVRGTRSRHRPRALAGPTDRGSHVILWAED